MKELIRKIINKETITYIIFGVLTTAVNYGVYYLFYRFTGIDPIFYNAIAWIAAVVFAFITNKLFVFESKSFKSDILLPEIASFFAARILSLLVETGLLALAIKVFGLNELFSKIVIAVIVVILNYFASKFLIFRKRGQL